MRFKLNKTILDNGLTIMTAPDDHVKSVTIQYVIKSGSYNESDDNRGIAHFSEHMLFKGTGKRTCDEINTDIAKIGGYTNAYTSVDRTAFYISSAAEHWKTTTEILSDLVWNNTIPEDEFDKERQVIIEEIKMYDDNPQDKCMAELQDMIYKDHANMHNIIGTIESVSAIKRQQMLDYIDKYYVPSNACIIACGNIDHDEFVKYVKSIVPFDIESDIPDVMSGFKPEDISNRKTIVHRNIAQAHLCYAVNALPSTDKDDYVQLMINYIIGKGMTSRLYKSIREDKGLAYTVSSFIQQTKDNAYLCVYTALDAENIPMVLDIINDELSNMAEEKVTDDELNIAKEQAKSAILIDLENTTARVGLLENNFVEENNETMDSIIERIDKVTQDDVLRVSKKLFTKDNFCYSEVVPREE